MTSNERWLDLKDQIKYELEEATTGFEYAESFQEKTSSPVVYRVKIQVLNRVVQIIEKLENS